MLLRLALVAILLFASLRGAPAQGKLKKAPIDAKKLVGTWEPIVNGKPEGTVIHFTKDGKLTLSRGKTEIARGAYKVSGDRIDFELKFDNETAKKGRLRIHSLSDKELVAEDLERKNSLERYLRRK